MQTIWMSNGKTLYATASGMERELNWIAATDSFDVMSWHS